MSGLTFHLVDVFGQEKYTGNQLAVFINAGGLATVEMQKIANEMHFSETTFLLSSQQRNGGYDVRIFTPKSEIPFAGHPTLGTACVIKHFIAGDKEDKVTLNLKVGQIPVTFKKNADQETLWMKQVSPVFGETFTTSKLAKVLQINEADFDHRFPIQEVSTGMPFIIVPLKTLDAAKRATINITRLREMASEVKGGILIFCSQTIHGGTDVHVRVFVDLFGIPEDPATGSGNGCLAGYLSHYRYFGTDEVDVTVE
jgi:trans-2,3-dihydro-3-hydroxyanthranilate isomerase